VQRFVLQENIRLLNSRLATAGSADEKRRIQLILTAIERELALLGSTQDGVLTRATQALRAENETVRAELIAWFREQYAGSPKIASLIDPAPGLVFVETNEAYTTATGIPHDEIVGQSLFSRFPENPDDPAADGMHNFFMSLRKVAETGLPDTMELLRYDLQDPDGNFRERYWRPVTSPLFDKAGNLVFLMQEVDEVTEEIVADRSAA
jgi:PAS domain-containing protein